MRRIELAEDGEKKYEVIKELVEQNCLITPKSPTQLDLMLRSDNIQSVKISPFN